jgi:glutamate-1-semialdehyde aminotransferase/spore coat polysaccharide biosynthesis protein SpsF (cytidylyltransferase family)
VKIIGVTQARIGSSRLPGKVLLKINNKTLLEYHLERAIQSKLIDKWIVATTNEINSDLICDLCSSLHITSFKGSTNDVLDRFYYAVKDYSPDYVVRITSDCPLIDPDVIDQIVGLCVIKKLDYLSNTLEPTFPDGIDVEVFSFNALEKAWKESFLKSDREHVTPYIWRNSTFFDKTMFKSENYNFIENLSNIRLTVDYMDDYELIKLLISNLGGNLPFNKYVHFLNQNRDFLKLNSNFRRNEGFMKSIEDDSIQSTNVLNFTNSKEYRKEIHKLIPGGAHTYSKGDDQFPSESPAAIDYGKGAWVWDIDGNKLLDCSMGLTSVTLGHAFEPILDRVFSELEKGVNFQRPSVIEREMAKSFLSLIPQHHMIKFAKNGSIVTTAAIKLARAKTGRKMVAFPGDHPFYSYDDWFIGKTECNLGVPEEISNLSLTFESYNIESLKTLFENYPNEIACVITEPEKNFKKEEDVKQFLFQAIELAHANGALFIIDEMITGFKTSFPGSTTKFNLRPDLCTWGKSIANGFSFCALTGTRDVMELGGIDKEGREKLFLISTTHGGETHAIGAGLATIDFYKNNDVINHNLQIGELLFKECTLILKKFKLDLFIEISETYWFLVFNFKNKNYELDSKLRTLFLQEMIKNRVLFQGAFVPSFSHNQSEIDFFIDAFKKSCRVYKSAMNGKVDDYLIGKECKPVFRKII